MTASIMSAAIMALDGPDLTLLAFELGMAPEGSMLWPDAGCVYDSAGRACWEPHANLVQADAVLRRLRTHGWHTSVRGARQSGTVCTEYAGDDEALLVTSAVMVTWPGREADTEAMALERCAVLAMASAKTSPLSPAPGRQ